MRSRAILVLGLFGGCMRASNVVGDVDYALPDGAGIGQIHSAMSLHIAPDGKATRSGPIFGVQTTALGEATWVDLHMKIDEANFPALKGPYTGCSRSASDLCPPLAVGGFQLTAEVNSRAYTTTGDVIILEYSDATPPGLVSTVRLLQQIAETSNWQ